MNPLEIAGRVAESVGESDEVESASAAPPGFVNLIIRDTWLQAQVDTIRAERERFGDVELGGGAKVPGGVRQREPDRARPRRPR